jgi:hypothetical protein
MEAPTYDYSFYLKRGFRIIRKNYQKKHIEFYLENPCNGKHWGRFEICSSDKGMELRFSELLEHTKTLQDVAVGEAQ